MSFVELDEPHEEDRSWPMIDWILCIVIIATIIAMLIGWAKQAIAAGSGACEPLTPVKVMAEKHGTWSVVTQPQLQFLRGIYAMNPLTPPGLPMGDQAAIARQEGNSGGLIVFIDGDKACTPMPVPKALLDLLATIAAGRIIHEGDPL